MTPFEPSAPHRIYAVGDIHGRADLLDQLLRRVLADCGADAQGVPIVFLGDYVDRGLQSRETIERLLQVSRDERFAARFLRGNHEAAMLDFLNRPEGGAAWLAYGGAETLYSYGVKAPALGANADHMHRAAEKLREKLPLAHMDFLTHLELWVQHERYVFVHAGLRPGRALEAQQEQDMLTIRDSFIKSRRKWPFVVVHGHTPGEEVFVDKRRICVDTGAYVTGKLSAVRLEGADVRILST